MAQYDRFVRNCLDMQAALADADDLGRLWTDRSSQMIDQLKAAPPQAGLASSRRYLLDIFGSGPYQPDSAALDRPLISLPLVAYQRLVRRAFGFGRLGNALLGPFPEDRLGRQLSVASRQNYSNAVRAGFLLLQDVIRRYDVTTPDSFGEQRVEVEGRMLGWKTLESLKQAEALAPLLGGAETVVEIGGGTGELARLMLRTGRTQRYIIVDIPPALAFAQEVILDEIPEPDILQYRQPAPTKEEIAQARCVFLLASQTDAISEADVGLNISSFQEMTRDLVSGYATFIKRTDMTDFVSVNYRNPHPLNAEQDIGERFYEETFGPEFHVKNRFAWDKTLDTELRHHDDSYDGSQVLHFTR